MQPFLDFLKNNAGLVAILGVIVGWGLSSLTSLFLYRRQKKDDEEKDRKERFKHKGELLASDGMSIPNEKIYNAKNLNALFCSYKANLNINGEVDVEFPKGINNIKKLKHHMVYLENIGESDINELEIAVESPKHHVLIEKNHIEEYVKKGLVNYGILLDRKIRKGEVILLTIYYFEDDPIVSLFSASLLLFYHDSLNNVCEQALFPEQNNTYPPSLITLKEWRTHVDVNKNLDHWKRRLNNKNL